MSTIFNCFYFSDSVFLKGHLLLRNNESSVQKTDPLSYEIELECGTVVRRHVDQDGRAG